MHIGSFYDMGTKYLKLCRQDSASTIKKILRVRKLFENHKDYIPMAIFSTPLLHSQTNIMNVSEIVYLHDNDKVEAAKAIVNMSPTEWWGLDHKVSQPIDVEAEKVGGNLDDRSKIEGESRVEMARRLAAYWVTSDASDGAISSTKGVDINNNDGNDCTINLDDSTVNNNDGNADDSSGYSSIDITRLVLGNVDLFMQKPGLFVTRCNIYESYVSIYVHMYICIYVCVCTYIST